MIAATEALRLPSAQLTEEQRTRVEKLDAEIEAHIRKNIERRGTEMQTKETDSNVCAEVNQRLKRSGWNVQWKALYEPNRFNKASMNHVGTEIVLGPSDEAYREVDKGEN